MPFANDDEIRIAHEVVLKGKQPFEGSRVDIIKKDSSCYIQACPGSGKTTALLAKLIILANRMPLPEGKGICVLTHTNVAIDEIKAKLGQKADVLFSYPNFFGTIQTFLHKYVATAALHYFYGSQIAYVDNDVARTVMLKKYNMLPWGALKSFIHNRVASKKHYISSEDVERLGGEELLTRLRIVKKSGVRVKKFDFQVRGYNTLDIPMQYRYLIKNKRDTILKEEGIDTLLKMHWDPIANCLKLDSMSICLQKDSAREYISVKESMFREGILSFKDAYDLAFRYISEKKLDFSSFSDKRFKYLFVDEVQDCDKQQVELIKQIFADNKIVVQRFGDYCQAIFEGEENEGVDNEELRGGNVLYIHNSNRFGENIAKPLRLLCMEDNHLLMGNPEVPSLKPVIITYEDPLKVIPKYVELLKTMRIPEMDNHTVLEIANKEKQEDPLHRVNVKACGWVGKKGANDQKRYIESYFWGFERKNEKMRMEGDSFDDFIFKKPCGTIKDLATSIIQGILYFLDLCDVKNGDRRYTRTSLLVFLNAIDAEKKDEFLSKVMRWSMLVAKSNGDDDKGHIKNQIYEYLTGTMLPLFEKETTEDAKTFFIANVAGNQDDQPDEQGNIYHCVDIDIEIATVHAVKGETHASTLYLETSYYSCHESERLSEQFKGNAYVGTDDKTLRSLRVAYVGMSRARYLLCVAIQKDRFDRMDCQDLRKIWDVVVA